MYLLYECYPCQAKNLKRRNASVLVSLCSAAQKIVPPVSSIPTVSIEAANLSLVDQSVASADVQAPKGSCRQAGERIRARSAVWRFKLRAVALPRNCGRVPDSRTPRSSSLLVTHHSSLFLRGASMNEDIVSTSAAKLAAHRGGAACPRICAPQTTIKAANSANPQITQELSLSSEPQSEKTAPMPSAHACKLLIIK
jgi:hypothetical protein